jgi:AraC-like DNA-binding protein
MVTAEAIGKDGAPDRLDYATTDLEAFQDVLSRLLQPRQPPPVVRGSPRARHRPRLSYRRAGGLAFAEIFYDQDVEIDVGTVDDCYVLQVPLTAGFAARLGGRYADFAVGDAQLAHPGHRLALRWRGGCRTLVVRHARRTLADHLDRLLQGNAVSRLPDRLSLATPSGASFLRFLSLLRNEADHGSQLLATPLAQRQAEQMLIALMLAAGGLLDGPDRPAAPAASYYVKRARDFMHANLGEPIGLTDIVAAGGVSVRTLYAGFRRELGQPPMSYLKALRLDRARAALRAGDPATTRVTDVAAEWGFLHFGRFAHDYRARFGEKPSDTLRRAN